MSTYAIIVTALLAGIIGYMVHAVQEEIYDAIERRKKESKTDDQEQMDQAVELVRDELGGTILSQENI